MPLRAPLDLEIKTYEKLSTTFNLSFGSDASLFTTIILWYPEWKSLMMYYSLHYQIYDVLDKLFSLNQSFKSPAIAIAARAV